MANTFTMPPRLWSVFPVPWTKDLASWKPTVELSTASGVSPDLRDSVMAGHIGRKLTASEVDRAAARGIDEPTALSDPQLALIHVWEVPELIGQEVRSEHAELLPVALAGLVSTMLGFPCEIPAGFSGALEKYGELEATVLAPPIASGSIPMALDVFGEIKMHNGVDPRTDRAMRRTSEYEEHGAEWPAVAQIRMATYSNVVGIRVGGAFYM